MNSALLIQRAIELGLRLKRRGDLLAVIPRDKCPSEFAVTLREHKAELLIWLDRAPGPGWQSIPPENLPLSFLEPRPTLQSWMRMIAYLVRQGCDRPSPLSAWLVRRESAYYDGPGRHWDCALITYAAARDAACWQLNLKERHVLELLQDFQKCRQDFTKS